MGASRSTLRPCWERFKEQETFQERKRKGKREGRKNERKEAIQGTIRKAAEEFEEWRVEQKAMGRRGRGDGKIGEDGTRHERTGIECQGSDSPTTLGKWRGNHRNGVM